MPDYQGTDSSQGVPSHLPQVFYVYRLVIYCVPAYQLCSAGYIRSPWAYPPASNKVGMGFPSHRVLFDDRQYGNPPGACWCPYRREYYANIGRCLAKVSDPVVVGVQVAASWPQPNDLCEAQTALLFFVRKRADKTILLRLRDSIVQMRRILSIHLVTTFLSGNMRRLLASAEVRIRARRSHVIQTGAEAVASMSRCPLKRLDIKLKVMHR